MKSLKRYQYEKYAVLCNLAYPRVFKQTRYGFDPNGQRIVSNRYGKTVVRILWSKDKEEAVIVIKGSHSLTDWLLTLLYGNAVVKHLAWTIAFTPVSTIF